MLRFWGTGTDEAKALVDSIVVRSTENFNWTFIFILAVVFYIYWTAMAVCFRSASSEYSLALVSSIYQSQ